MPSMIQRLEETRMVPASLKYICKSFGIVVTAMTCTVLVQSVTALKVYPLLTGLGRFGILSALVIDIIGVSVLIAALVVGLIGGKHIGGWLWNGFLLSGIYYLCYLALSYPLTGANPKIVVIKMLAWPLVVVAGGLIYSRVVRRKLGTTVTYYKESHLP
jgi:hypothetical protein